MRASINAYLGKLKLRWKMLAMVLPLVIAPMLLVGLVTGYIANHQAYLGITRTSKDDLEHMASFTIDLLQSHHHYANGSDRASAWDRQW